MDIQNGQLAGQNRVLEAVALGKSLREILRLTTESIENELPGSFASVLLANETETQLFSGSAESLSPEYNAAIDGIKIGEAVGSCGTAAFRREMVIVSDILNDPLWKDFSELAKVNNLRSCWSQPIFSPEGKLYGTFAIYFSEPREPQADELLLLQSTARIAGIAIEHKYIETKLRETQTRLEATLAASEIGTWTWDVVNNRVFADKNLAQMFSVSDENASGGAIEDYFSAIYPGDRERVSNVIRETLENEDIYETSYRLVKKDSSIRWVIARGRIERDETGKAIRLPGVVIDVTETHETEKKLRDSQSRFSGALSIAQLGAFDWDLITNDVFFDDRSRKIFGFPPSEEIKADKVFARIHPEDVNHVYASAMKSIGTAVRLEIEYRIVLSDGTVRIVQSINDPIIDEKGRADRMIGIFSDVSEARQAENAVRESAEKYRTLFESIDSGFCIIEMIYDVAGKPIDWRFLEANPAFEKNNSIKDVAGKTITEMAPDIEPKWFEIYGRVAQTGEPERFVEGSEALKTWFDVYAFRIGESEERKLAVLFNDISAQKTAEQEREKLLESEQAARAEAENSNRLKDEFLATLSHELRTPLNAILGWTQILLKGKFGETQQHKALMTIDRSARAQNQLIEDILDVSRIITGKMRLNVQAVNFLNVISSAIESARPSAEAKNINIQTLLDPEATAISGDPDRLQQVVWNLLSNAIKFTPKGGRVQIRLERVNSSVEATVSDTGKGIDPEFLPFVFDRFRQSDGSMTRRQGGLGLGLAIVRQIIELHGGTVAVNSQGEDQGASFTITLPVLPLRQEPDSKIPRIHPEAANNETVIDEINPEELSGLRILIVDDEMDSQEVLRVLLSSSGAEVMSADSAKKALEIIKRERFDVIISDIGMPEEDGFSLIEKVRRLTEDKGGKTPAIALTAYARLEDRIKALRSGFQMHIAKPVEHSELIATIVALSGRTN